MKLLLATLPLFQTQNAVIPNLGVASIKAYINKYLPEVNVDTLDLRTKADVKKIWHPEDFFQTTAKNNFVSDIYDLPIIVDIISKFIKKVSINEFLSPNIKILNKWALERSILPELVLKILKETSTFALKNLTKFGGYDLIGFSTYTSNLYLSILTAILIKINYPKTKIIFGGPQITQSKSTRKLLLKFNIADYLILGEGEEPTVKLLSAILESSETKNIIGLKDKDNFDLPDTFYQEMDLEKLPTPDYSGTNLFEYTPKLLSVFSNRGCPFRCHFCSEHSIFGKTFKRRSSHKVLKDMFFLNNQHTLTHFHFSDSLVNSSEDWLNSFIEEKKAENNNFTWEGYFRAQVSKDLAYKLSNAGLLKVTLGVESFSQEILNNMNKKKEESEIVNSIHYLVENNVIASVNLIVGFPEETEDSFLTTLNEISKLYNYFESKGKLNYFKFNLKTFQLRPFSTVYNYPQKFGIETKTWAEFFDENIFDNEFEDIFNETLFTFKVKNILIPEVNHRVSLLNQLKNLKLLNAF